MEKEKKYLCELENISFKPIFILGLPRSGTSILYKTLVSSNCFNYVNIYHILEYDHLLNNYISGKESDELKKIDQFFSENDVTNRGIDSFEARSTTPEEYGFILYKKTRKNLTVKKNLDLLFELCKKIQFISKNNRPILLKNPQDIFRFVFIKKKIPDAKFIFIHRHPFNSINSGLGSERFLYKEKPFYHSKIDSFYDEIYNYYLLVLFLRFLYNELSPLGVMAITRHMKKFMNTFLENIKNIKKSEYINIKYEEFCKNPNDTIGNILKFLELDSVKKIEYKDLIKTRNLTLDPAVSNMRRFIYKKTRAFFEYNGYKYY
jgi:hypothetical protein